MDYPQTLSRSALSELLSMTGSPAITIYLPTHRAGTGPNINEDQIRCKNLFRQAKDTLTQKGDDSSLTEELAQLQTAMLEDKVFWDQTNDGLLICAVPGAQKMFYLPTTTEEYVAVDDTLHLAPVFSAVSDSQDYYVLALAQHEPCLYEGTSQGLKPSDILLPASVEQALNIDEKPAGEQQRSAAAGENGGKFNGRGGSKDSSDDDRQYFWRQIDKLLVSNPDNARPLILAGTDSELAEFRAISHYPNILSSNIVGSYGGERANALQLAAPEIIRHELVDAAHQKIIADFSRLQGANPQRIATDDSALRDAVAAGRIETLLVGMLRNTTDTVQDNIAAVPVITFYEHDAASHIIAQSVWQAGGVVVNVEPETMLATGSSVAAILRY